jgi:predicted peptidase
VSSPSKIRGMDAGVQETLKQQGFRPEKFTDSRGYTFPYRMLMPTRDPMQDKAGSREVDPERMPLVLMLHGWNERGDDNSAQLRNGVAELLGREAAALHFPCFYVVPQCSAKRSWVEVDMEAEHHVIPSEPSIPLSAVVELIDALLASFPIDPQRLYLIGLSMGGFGVWELLSRWPERFAAAVPICGGADENANSPTASSRSSSTCD